MSKKLLITGSNGFVGRACLKIAALEYDFELHGTYLSTEPDYGAFPNVIWHKINLLDINGIDNLISKIKPTHIIHTAWETTHGAYWSSNLNFEWLVIGPHLLKVFAANGGEKFVSAGTLAEYDWSYSYFTEGVSPELPATIYGKAKKYHHDIMSDYSNALGVQYATGRIFYGYGPYENRARIIPYTFLSLLGGKSANLSPCDFYRDYLYIDDIADGFLKVLDSDFSGAINISSATPYLLADIMNTIGEVAERQDLINLGANQKRANDVNMLVGDNNILKSLGWKQRTNLTQGIQLSYQWWKDNYQ